MKCPLCTVEYERAAHMSRHLNSKHNTSYEALWLMSNERPQCVICDALSQWRGDTYGDTCGSRKCSAIVMRKRLKQDDAKYAAFVSKVKANTEYQHSVRTEEEVADIYKRISATRREANAKLSKAELSERYGKNKKGHYQSLENFWRTASAERKEEIIQKRHRNYGANVFNDDAATNKLLETIDAFFAKNPRWVPEPFRGLIDG